ncbi:MAG TPA: efflux RND transporter periplasmic adaptor subunit [Gemmatimonadaceae bacterium]
MTVTATPRSLGLLFAASLVVGACNGKEAESATPETPATVAIGPENIAVVTEGELSAGPAISGALGPEREATVRAQVPGAVMRVSVDQGVRVRAGQSLAQIDDRTLRDAFLSARSAFNTASNAAERAKRDLERMERLAQAGAIAERDLEQARLTHTGAGSQLADAQARLTMAQKQLDDAQIRAPFAGIVSVRSVSEGDVVAPGAALFSIVDPASMRFEASVPAAQLSQVKVGAPVTFSVSGYPERRFTGRVARISPTVDPATGQVRLMVSVPNESSSLVAGLFANGRIATERRTGLTAPYAAVDMRGLKPTVLRLKSGLAERVEVALGVRDEDLERYEILAGVAAGDTLLIGAAQGITPGTAVKVSVPSDQPPAK